MPSQQDHLEQAKSNERVAKRIEKDFPDWSVTMCFYAALHWVEQYAKKQGVDIREYDGNSLHARRRQYVDDVAYQLRSRTLRNAYETLERSSRKSRYLEDLELSATKYYNQERQKVTDAFQKLQIVQQLLKS
ncbi:MAG: hypothetical protein VKJ24_08595 [Synechococcales bacterium]|nr:hypothetical protein [Synechococcales bacterium]